MSKKSRKRNKKILGALAAGLGAMALAKRGRGEISSNRPSGIDAASAAKNWISKKADTAVAAPTKVNLGNTRLTRDGVTPGMVLNARRKVPGYGTALGPPSVLNPYQTPRVHVRRGEKSGGRIGAKKGGSVTGAAKRGFGRALMKGKK